VGTTHGSWRPTGNGPIPKQRYIDPAFLQLELEHVFGRAWLLAGPVADVETPGSYFTFDLGDESVLVVRHTDGVKAFHNVCAHRGRMLREPGLGHARSFRCPYHLWEYALDGELIGLPEPECFAASLPGERPRLRPVSVETWAGFVWINFHHAPEPLADFLAPVADRLLPYALDEYALLEDQTVDLPCNWKVGVDAFNEAYHLRAVHPQLLQMLDETHVELDLFGRHSCIRVPFGVVSPSLGNSETVNDHLKYLLTDAGLDPARFAGPASTVRTAIQRFLRQRNDLELSGLSDAQLTDNHQYYVFPNLTLNIYAMKHMLLRHRPHPSDPNRMLLDQQQYVRVPRGTKRPPRPKPQRFRYGSGSLGFVTDQDTFNLVRVQRGLRSSGFDGMILGDNERRIRHMHQTIDEYITRAS
jgi:phenylpropionate dioxygenase-like ring-hydroxylating dioxygenase large terminal subunit